MIRRTALSAAVLLLLAAGHAAAQGPLTTAFTYQGELRQSGSPVTGTYDLRFRLYNAPTAGTQLGPTLCADNVAVATGRFSASLDFGAQFTGQQTFLEIDVRQDTGLDCTNATGFTTLAPRQSVTAEPNSLFSLTAGTASTASTATNATQLNGQAPSFYQNAANLSSGTIPSARLSGTYSSPLILSSNTNSFTGSGAGLTNIPWSSIAGAPSSVLLNPAVAQTGNLNISGTGTFGSVSAGGGLGTFNSVNLARGVQRGGSVASVPTNDLGLYSEVASDWLRLVATAAPIQFFCDGGGGTTPLMTIMNTGGASFNSLGGSLVGILDPDPSPSSVWPSGTYPPGTAYNSAGELALYGAAHNARWGVRSRFNVGSSVFPNQAEMFMDDATATRRLRLYMSGEGGAQGSSGNVECTNLFVSGSKSFITPNPFNPEQDIVYYCMEGPENGIYLRGTGHLAAGHAHIDLPDTFSSIASKDGLTVILTPLSLDSRGLACAGRTVRGFDVGELMQGSGEYDFDWEVKAVRRGMRDKPVLVPWTEHAMGAKTQGELWTDRQADIERRDADFAKEDQELGARP